MVTLTTVNWIAEADFLCTLLEASGITTLVPDQGTVTANPTLAHAIGGIRIQVAERDLARAREIVNERATPSESGLFECPQCGSNSVQYENVSKRFAFMTLIMFGIPLLWRKRQCKCDACGHTMERQVDAANTT
jgi:predicted RNA-binding Zn-ribbon protein involved in translation (DUF1610 family)